MGLNLLLIGVISYLLGAVPTGAIVGRVWTRADLLEDEAQDFGSLGVWQRVGSAPAALSFVINILKGLAVIWIAKRFGLTEWAMPWAGTLAVVGYCWSPFLDFQGGMGIGVAVGEVLLSMPLVSITLALIWLGWAMAFRHRPRAVGATAVLWSVLAWFFGYPPPHLTLALLVGGILFIRQIPHFRRQYRRFWIV